MRKVIFRSLHSIKIHGVHLVNLFASLKATRKDYLRLKQYPNVSWDDWTSWVRFIVQVLLVRRLEVKRLAASAFATNPDVVRVVIGLEVLDEVALTRDAIFNIKFTTERT